LYLSIKELNEKKQYTINLLCEIAEIQRSAYYKWLGRKESSREKENKKLADRIKAIHGDLPELGYRRMRDVLMLARSFIRIGAFSIQAGYFIKSWLMLE
jgi:hypothetical protein